MLQHRQKEQAKSSLENEKAILKYRITERERLDKLPIPDWQWNSYKRQLQSLKESYDARGLTFSLPGEFLNKPFITRKERASLASLLKEQEGTEKQKLNL